MKKNNFVFLTILILFFSLINVFAKEEYLKMILIDGKELEGFDTSKNKYEYNVSNDTDSIKLVYNYDKSIYNASTTGNAENLNYGINTLTLTLTNKENSENTITYTLIINREDLRSKDNTLSSLTVGGVEVKLTTATTYDVEVNSDLKKAEVRAVLNSNNATFVQGYGERVGNNSITLNGEKTTFSIKVEAENKDIKEYVINILRKNLKNSDATLKSLTIDNIAFDFKSNILEYNLEVNSDIEKIKIVPIANNDKSTISAKREYNLNYEQNKIEIKVEAEDGTVKNYILNINRLKPSDDKTIKDLQIKDIDIVFDPNKLEYEVETELKKLDITVTLNSEKASYEIIGNNELENNSVINIKVIAEDKSEQIYKIVIINDEEIVIEEETENNDDISVDNQNKLIEFYNKYELIIALSVFGIGLIVFLIAIVTKRKSSKLM